MRAGKTLRFEEQERHNRIQLGKPSWRNIFRLVNLKGPVRYKIQPSCLDNFTKINVSKCAVASMIHTVRIAE